MTPAAETPSTSTHRSASSESSSTTSKSSTRLSASSTSVCTSRASFGMASILPGAGPLLDLRTDRCYAGSRETSGETQPAGDHVLGHRSERAVLGEAQRRASGRGPRRQSHRAGPRPCPTAWWTTKRKSAPASSSAPSSPGRGIGLHGQDRSGGHPGQHHPVGVLLVVQRTGAVPVEVEGADADGPHPHREPEDGHGAGSHRRRGECDPPSRRRRRPDRAPGPAGPAGRRRRRAPRPRCTGGPR